MDRNKQAKAIFFDRDGTLLSTPDHYITDPEHVDFFPGVPESLKFLREIGYRLIVVTNQAAVGRGMLSEINLLSVHNHMKRELAAAGAPLDAVYFSAFFPSAIRGEHRAREQDRKPNIGLFEKAVKRYGLDVKQCFMIGDSDVDIESAHRLGCRSALVRTGRGAVTEGTTKFAPDFVAATMIDSAIWIGRQTVPQPLAGKRVLMVVAQKDFQQTEYLTPRLALAAAGADVRTAAPKAEPALGHAGLAVTPDVTIAAAKAADYDAVVFAGGEGARGMHRDPACVKLARDAANGGKLIGAICIAPAVLAAAGVLAGKTAVVWHSEIPNLLSNGAKISEHRRVVVDGRVITASGPADAADFAQALMDAMDPVMA